MHHGNRFLQQKPWSSDLLKAPDAEATSWRFCPAQVCSQPDRSRKTFVISASWPGPTGQSLLLLLTLSLTTGGVRSFIRVPVQFLCPALDFYARLEPCPQPHHILCDPDLSLATPSPGAVFYKQLTCFFLGASDSWNVHWEYHCPSICLTSGIICHLSVTPKSPTNRPLAWMSIVCVQEWKTLWPLDNRIPTTSHYWCQIHSQARCQSPSLPTG